MLIRQQRSDGSLVRVLSAHTAMRLRIIEKNNYQVLLVGIFSFYFNKKNLFFVEFEIDISWRISSCNSEQYNENHF
jgi:hypothetical protein